MARAIQTLTVRFGLVVIPMRVFTAASSDQVRFNMLHKKCGGRQKQKMVCPACDVEVAREDTVKGYEVSKGQYVTFSEDELHKLEAERTNAVDINEFVPATALDPAHVEKSYYLGPDKGGDRAYRLLGEVLRASGRYAIGVWATRGKEQLVAIRPHGGSDGLLLHQLFHADEVRAFDEVDAGGTFKFSDAERQLALRLVEQLSVDTLDASKYHDGYRDRVRDALDQKVAGLEVAVAAPAPQAQIIDLMEALKKSLAAKATTPAPKTSEEASAERPPVRSAKPRAAGMLFGDTATAAKRRAT